MSYIDRMIARRKAGDIFRNEWGRRTVHLDMTDMFGRMRHFMGTVGEIRLDYDENNKVDFKGSKVEVLLPGSSLWVSPKNLRREQAAAAQAGAA